MLKNFKKLAHSFLHTSNSVKSQLMVICDMADLFSAEWHTRRTVKQKNRREEKNQKAAEKSEKGLDETQLIR